MSIKQTIERIAAESAEGLGSVYWTGCGQSLGAMHPAHYFLRRQVSTISSFWENAREFASAPPAGLNASSLLVANSHSGNTQEVVAAASAAKNRGAHVASLIYKDGSALGDKSDGVIKYEWGPDRHPGLEKSACALRLAVEIARRACGYSQYSEFAEAFESIDPIVARAREASCGAVRDFAGRNRESHQYYVVGGGASYGAAYNEVIALLQSLWIHAGLMHSGEFRHGPIEIVDGDATFIVLANPGASGDAEREACDFIRAHTDRCLLLDSGELGLLELPESVREYFGFAVFSNVLELFNRRLSELREHPLSTKRYMAQV